MEKKNEFIFLIIFYCYEYINFFGSTLLAFNWFDSYFLRFLASLRSLYITFFLLLEVSFFPYMKSKLKICLIYFSIYRKPTTSKTPSFKSPFSLILSLSEILTIFVYRHFFNFFIFSSLIIISYVVFLLSILFSFGVYIFFIY
jgi:hypothetical protein